MEGWSKDKKVSIEDLVDEYSTLINTYVQQDLKKQYKGLINNVDKFDIKGKYGDQAINKMRINYEKDEGEL